MQEQQLTGSKKQIKWAEEIRQNTVRRLEKNAKSFSQGYQKSVRSEVYSIIKDFMASIIESETEAKWWIENRQCTSSGFINRVDLDRLLNEKSIAQRKYSKELKNRLSDYKEQKNSIF